MRKARGSVALVIALLAGALIAGPAKAALAECPEVMPVDDLTDGMMGTGYTVSEGTDPDPFDAEILGVLQDGIGPGRDMIIVDTSSPAIDAAGGIWYGMSGSPVYINNKFVGAVAYGLSWGPNSVGGVTPAEDMLKIADRPTADTARATGAQKVRLTDTMRARIAKATGVSQREVSANMSRLATPLSVSGAGDRVMSEIQKSITKEGLPLIPYKGASASAIPGPAAPPEAGGNFAAALSYGDITYAGVGTTSYVCDGKILAFGHPFYYYPMGDTVAGGNTADAITIIQDDIGGSYKLANVGGGFGTVDQDRFAGIRAIVGDMPATIPVTSHVETADGYSQRDGETDVVDSRDVPYLALYHMLANIDFTRDEIDAGGAEASWTITGTDEAGEPWSFTRSNLFTSEYDINYESLFELESELYTIFYNQYEDIEFTGIDYSTTLEEDVNQYTMSIVEVSKDGVNYEAKRRIRVQRGGTVYVRLTLEPYGTDEADVVMDYTVELPNNIRNSASIQLTSGGGNYYDYYDNYYCIVYGEACGSDEDKIETFQELLDFLESTPKNNELSATLYGNRGQERWQQIDTLDRVVSGFKNIRIRINGSGGGSIGVVGEG